MPTYATYIQGGCGGASKGPKKCMAAQAHAGAAAAEAAGVAVCEVGPVVEDVVAAELSPGSFLEVVVLLGAVTVTGSTNSCVTAVLCALLVVVFVATAVVAVVVEVLVDELAVVLVVAALVEVVLVVEVLVVLIVRLCQLGD